MGILQEIGRHTDVSSGKMINGKVPALCHFHEEKTASIVIDPKHNSFCCYGCGRKGDADDFKKMIEEQQK